MQCRLSLSDSFATGEGAISTTTPSPRRSRLNEMAVPFSRRTDFPSSPLHLFPKRQQINQNNLGASSLISTPLLAAPSSLATSSVALSLLSLLQGPMPVLLKLPSASVSRIEEEADSAHLPLAHGALTLSTLDSGRFDGTHEEKVLLLTIGDFHYRLLPHLTISHSPSLNTYTLPPKPSSSTPSPPSMLVTLPFPSSTSDELDQTTLLTLLTQYLTLVTHNPPSSALKNKILLIDDDTGAVIGEMDVDSAGLELVDDSKGEKGPVLVDLNGRSTDGTNRVVVTEVPQGEMEDWMLRGAANLGGKMLKGASLLSTKMTKASERYVERTVPREEPVVVSDRTKANLRVVNKSTLAVRSTVAKGTGFINRNIQKGMEFAVEHGHEGSVKALTFAREKQAQRKSSHSSFDSLSRSPPPSSPSNEKDSNDLLISFDDDDNNEKASSVFSNDSNTTNSPSSGRKPPPPVPSKPSHLSTSPNARAEMEISKRPLFSRLLLAGDVLYTSFGSSYETVLGSAAENSTKSISHKYGEEAGSASAEVGGSVRNVSAAFFDARGVGRRALVKGAGKGYIKTRMKDERGKVYSTGGEVVGGLEEDQVHQGQLIALANEKSTPPLGSPSSLSAPPPSYSSSPSGPRSSSSSLKEKSPSWSSSDPLPPPPPNRVVLPPPVRTLTRPTPASTPPPLAARPKPKPKTSTGWQRPKAPTSESFDSTTDRVSVGMGGLDLGSSGRDRLRTDSPEPLLVVERTGTPDRGAVGAGGGEYEARTRRNLPPPVPSSFGRR